MRKHSTALRAVSLAILGAALVAASGGCRTRVPFDASIAVSNFSNQFVDVYVNGGFEGTVTPFGSFTIDVHSGTHELFAEGATRVWGPDIVVVPAGQEFVWELFP